MPRLPLRVPTTGSGVKPAPAAPVQTIVQQSPSDFVPGLIIGMALSSSSSKPQDEPSAPASDSAPSASGRSYDSGSSDPGSSGSFSGD